MRALLFFNLIIGLLYLAEPVIAQTIAFEDGFEDGNFSSNPAWSGDTTNFAVIEENGNHLLQLKASEAGQSFLSTPSSSTIGSWDFFERLDFSPSGSNFAYIFLMSDTSDLRSGNPSGYALRIGESGTSDRFRLVRFDNGTEAATLISGTTDISGGGEFRVKITRDPGGIWSMKVGNGIGGLLSVEGGTATDNTYSSSTHFGILLTYTSSRTDKFFFDFKIDLPPLELTTITAIENSIKLNFNRSIDQTSVQTADFIIDEGIGSPNALEFPEPATVILKYDNEIPSGEYSVTIEEIKDLSGTVILSGSEFRFLVFEEAVPGDVIINEFMYDPPDGGTEYIELKNLTNNFLNLRGWTAGDENTLATISTEPLVLKSNGFLVLADDTVGLSNQFGSRPYHVMRDLPSLNNSGDLIKITDDQQVTFDSLRYTPEWGGKNIALERLSPEVTSVFKENWADSPDSLKGTPGLENSAPPDTAAPKLSGLEVTENLFITLAFNERIEEKSAALLTNYSITNDAELSSVSQTAPDSVQLSLKSPLQNAANYRITVSGIRDIFGNSIVSEDSSFTHFIISKADSGDIHINEFMYDPPGGLSEFVELFNSSNKSIDLSTLRINDGTGSRKRLTFKTLVIPPDSFAVLAPDSSLLDPLSPKKISLIAMGNRFPSLNNSSDDIVLRDENGILFDSLRYENNWGGESISLERRTVSVKAEFRENWGLSPSVSGTTSGLPNQVPLDTLPPFLNDFTVIDNQSVSVIFNERITLESALNPENYTFSNNLMAEDINFLPPDTVRISVNTLFQNARQVELLINGVTDIFGNRSEVIDTLFTFFDISLPDSGDVFINEFLHNPPDGTTEFIEIINPGSKSFDLKNWTIGDNTGRQNILKFDSHILPPNSITVLAPDESLLKSFPDIDLIAMGSRFPSLNNSGDAIVLKNDSGRTLDSLTYTKEWGTDVRSLERRTVSVSGQFRENWGHTPEQFGTPGIHNSIEPDVIPPKFISLQIQDNMTLNLIFSERLNPKSVERSNSLSIFPDPGVDVLFSRSNSVKVKLQNELVSGTSYQVTVSNFEDLFGNKLENAEKTIEFLEFSEPAPQKIVINEILFNKTDQHNFEFIELFNNTPQNFDLSNWMLGDRSGFSSIPESTVLRANDYIVFTGDITTGLTGSNILVINGFPSLNNSEDAVVLKTGDGTIVDSLFYSSNWGNEPEHSLERRDPFNASNDSSNWRSASNVNGITPGLQNSVFEIDVEKPKAVFATVNHANQIEVRFSEFIRINQDEIYRLAGAEITPGNSGSLKDNTVILTTKTDLLNEKPPTLIIENFSDIRGNTREKQEIPIAYPIQKGDVVINEIMFEPLTNSTDNLPDQSEYIELHNLKPHAVSAEGILLHDQPDENGVFRPVLPVDSRSKWIPPNGYILIHADNEPDFINTRIVKFFDSFEIDPAFTIRVHGNGLGLKNDQDRIFLTDSSGIAIDSVFYRNSWHNSGIFDTRGVSLEKVNPGAPGNEASNWGSSAEKKGGTPGRQNSVFQIPGEDPLPLNSITFTPNPFSPDGDGNNDRLFINYKLDQFDYRIRIRIFDRYGRQIRLLADNIPGGFEGSVIWDGKTQAGNRNRIGIYVVLFEAFGSSVGRDKTFKEVVVIARQL